MRTFLAIFTTFVLLMIYSCHGKFNTHKPCSCETCYDGIKNQNETGVDCGGVCAPCNDSTEIIVLVDTTYIYDTIINFDTIVLNDTIIYLDTIIMVDTIIDTVFYSDTYTVTIQPDGECGKDAVIHSLDLFTSGEYEHFWAATWTWNGGNWGIMRSLVEFDLDPVPNNVEIIVARLSLFGKKDPPDQHSLYEIYGTYNFGVINRITDEWEENLVSWDDQPEITTQNQVFLHPSNKAYEDYLDIDVTKLVEDMLNNPESGYGFRISLFEEEIYRMLAFCTSDNQDPDLRPKLVITYILND